MRHLSGTVVKLGGSLFDCMELKTRLQQATKQVEGPVWIVPGGGNFANELRRLDRIHHWTNAQAHALGIRAMSLGAQLIASLDSRWRLITTLPNSPQDIASDVISIIDVAGIENLMTLPASWELTSDSISAWITHQIGARRLILLKSATLPTPAPSLESAAEAGLVDRFFPQFAGPVHRIDWCNLRADEFVIQSWTSNESGSRDNDSAASAHTSM